MSSELPIASVRLRHSPKREELRWPGNPEFVNGLSFALLFVRHWANCIL